MDDLAERYALHRRGSLPGAVVHLHARKFALLLPAVVGREERSHTRLVLKRLKDEIMEIEQRHVVHRLIIAHEIVVFVAQHPESENHRHCSSIFRILFRYDTKYNTFCQSNAASHARTSRSSG